MQTARKLLFDVPYYDVLVEQTAESYTPDTFKAYSQSIPLAPAGSTDQEWNEKYWQSMANDDFVPFYGDNVHETLIDPSQNDWNLNQLDDVMHKHLNPKDFEGELWKVWREIQY